MLETSISFFSHVFYMMEGTCLRQTLFPADFHLSPEACEKSIWWLWKECCVKYDVRQPGNTCASPFVKWHLTLIQSIKDLSFWLAFICGLQMLSNTISLYFCHVLTFYLIYQIQALPVQQQIKI